MVVLCGWTVSASTLAWVRMLVSSSGGTSGWQLVKIQAIITRSVTAMME